MSTNKETKRKYFLVIETFDRFDTTFEIVEVEATNTEEAVKGYLDGDFYLDDGFTADGENGRFAGEEHTIGIGVTKEAAALQYALSRAEN